MSDLRTLAQAVVDTSEEADRSIFAPAADIAAENAACELGQALGYPRGADATVSTAHAILAALNAERAQGYARAMGEVVERCEGEYVRYVGHSGAMHAAVRDTRRGMVAALYWQAGIYACGSVVAGENGYIERCRALAERADALRCTADAMEFPL